MSDFYEDDIKIYSHSVKGLVSTHTSSALESGLERLRAKCSPPLAPIKTKTYDSVSMWLLDIELRRVRGDGLSVYADPKRRVIGVSNGYGALEISANKIKHVTAEDLGPSGIVGPDAVRQFRLAMAHPDTRAKMLLQGERDAMGDIELYGADDDDHKAFLEDFDNGKLDDDSLWSTPTLHGIKHISSRHTPVNGGSNDYVVATLGGVDPSKVVLAGEYLEGVRHIDQNGQEFATEINYTPAWPGWTSFSYPEDRKRVPCYRLVPGPDLEEWPAEPCEGFYRRRGAHLFRVWWTQEGEYHCDEAFLAPDADHPGAYIVRTMSEPAVEGDDVVEYPPPGGVSDTLEEAKGCAESIWAKEG